MSLNKNYFLLYHGIHLSKENPILIDEKINDETFFEVSALLLGVNKNNFYKIKTLKSFDALVLLFTSKAIDTLDSIYHLQYSIIEHFILSRSMINVQHLHLSFAYLLEKKIFKRQEYDKLISLFDPSLFEKKPLLPYVNMSENFHTYKQAFMVSLNELKEITKKVKELESIENYLNLQHFSIGITGVMNAGKSTMLNALLGKEILGTSVVPETANLSIVKYSGKAYTKAVYWNKSQWKKIQKSGFFKETQLEYAEHLDEYIQTTALKQEIDPNQLKNFTSATSKNRLSNLVSHVEIGINLHFLHDGIEIVDTPGLDDVVVQREEITKEYIAQCDLMIHLMNVSQSATQKDIDFIIDAVLYQNITKLLIVITRADLVTKEELQEVIAYTKESISSKLHEQNSESKLDFILQNIHFIALSGEMAFLHKIGRAKEAEDKGCSLEQSGIVEVEDYLNETLFSKNSQKSSLIIYSAKKQLSSFVSLHLEKSSFELVLLGKNEDELEDYLQEMHKQTKSENVYFEELTFALESYEQEAVLYLASLTQFLQNELDTLCEVLKKRLLDETKYSLEKEKTTPQKRRIILIVDKAIKHGLVDILRDYRYKFSKKTKQISSALQHQFNDKSISLQELQTQALGNGFLTQNYNSFHESVHGVLKVATLKNLNTIESQLKVGINEEFSDISTMVKLRAGEISKE